MNVMERISYLEKEVRIESQYQLAGTLAIPNGNEKYPAVLLVAGSGEIDRDGTITKMKLNTNLYKDLAQMITSLDFVTLRYDKRGVGASGGQYNETGFWDLIEDIEAAYQYLKAHPNVDPDKIILLGHSEGSMLITAVSARIKANGLILLAGANETLPDALKRQREIALAELMNQKGFKGFLFRLFKIDKKAEKQAENFIAKIMNSTTDTIKYQFTTINAKWHREHFTYNVIEDLKKVAVPILALTGNKDFQANPERLKTFPNLDYSEVEWKIINDMDHGLKEYKGEISAINFKKQYKDSIGMPLHPDLQETITQWLQKTV